MARAILLVLDSFGCGAAEDAARFGDAGADTFGHIFAEAAAGRADRAGLRAGPLVVPNLARLGLGRARRLDRRAGPARRHARSRCLRPCGRDIEGQGHAVGPLGADGRARHLRLGLFPRDEAVFPEGPDRRADRAGEAARRARRRTRLRHRDHCAARPRAHGEWQADRLHLRRFRLQIAAHERPSASSACSRLASSRAGWSIRSASGG